ncbi:MAG: UMP kinase [Candidatus Pacearchaeota archaeon]
MKKKVIVLSLGGSLIIPDKVDTNFLKKFKKTLQKNTKKYKFVVACGGGSIARKYIAALQKNKANQKLQSFSGISATRMNARFMSYFFGLNPEKGIPHKMREIQKYLRKQDVVFCGALEYKPNQTSDSTAAQIAKKYKTIFINLTNVPGLYDKNPKKHKNAKFIPEISWKEFDKKAKEIKYKPGQHFVLDQTASEIIKEHKIPTYILGQDMKQLEAVLQGKGFKGTLIKG